MPGSASDLIVRASTSADLAAVDALLARSYPVLLKGDYPASVLVTALPLISRAQPRLVGSGHYFVAERDGVILAAGGWTRAEPGTGGIGAKGLGHIRHVVTDFRHVRQGIGRALMMHVLADARAANLRVLHCHSTHTAVPFYEAMGFVAQAEIEVMLRPGITFPAVFMVARLAV